MLSKSTQSRNGSSNKLLLQSHAHPSWRNILAVLMIGLSASACARGTTVPQSSTSTKQETSTPPAQSPAVPDAPVSTTPTTPTAQPPSANMTAETAKMKLTQFGFDCGQGVSKDRGLHCRGIVKGYPLPVHLYIPSLMKAQAQLDMILHLHGFNVGRDANLVHFRIDDGSGDFGSWLQASGRNSVLVAPESREQCDDFNAKLGNPAGLESFLFEISQLLYKVDVIQTPKIGSWSLTGHSGAYYPIASIALMSAAASPTTAKLTAISLFDSSYGRASDFVTGIRNRIKSKTPFRFWSAFIKGSQTEAVSLEIARQLAVKVEAVKLTIAPLVTQSFRVISVSGTQHGWFLKDDRYKQFLIETQKP